MESQEWSEIVKEDNHTLTGKGEIIENFIIPQLNRERRVWIYLPPDYNKSDKSYPVLYMHDGQNLFDEFTSNDGEWRIDETLEEFFKEERTEGVIVVGIDCDPECRRDEYSPWKRVLIGEGGQGEEYLEFLVETLKPYIDDNYRTLEDRKHTGIAGSSMGGFISLYGGLKYQDVFSKIGAFSPALFFHPDKMDDYIMKQGKKNWMKIYLDVGTTENLTINGCEIDNQDYVNDVRRVYNLLKKVGFTERELKFVIAESHEHHEDYWSKRFPEAFSWLFGE